MTCRAGADDVAPNSSVAMTHEQAATKETDEVMVIAEASRGIDIVRGDQDERTQRAAHATARRQCPKAGSILSGTVYLQPVPGPLAPAIGEPAKVEA